jgi:outer membrane protein assembly factor BamD
VLGHNYPGSDWYQDSYGLLTGKDIRPVENKKSWVSKAFGGVG